MQQVTSQQTRDAASSAEKIRALQQSVDQGSRGTAELQQRLQTQASVLTSVQTQLQSLQDQLQDANAQLSDAQFQIMQNK